MSQHRFTTKEHTIVLGWDNPLQTFFAQVWPGHDDDAWEEPLLWVGCLAGELATIDALTGALEPFGEIPEDLVALLRQDYDQRDAVGTPFASVLTFPGLARRSR
jgi:hypothetical protein